MTPKNGPNAPYKRGTLATGTTTIHVAVPAALIARIEHYRVLRMAEGEKISRGDVIERAMWEFVERQR